MRRVFRRQCVDKKDRTATDRSIVLKSSDCVEEDPRERLVRVSRYRPLNEAAPARILFK